MPSSNGQPSPTAAPPVPAAASTVPQPDKSPKLINLDSPNSNSDPTPPISVTHFSPAVNGSGVQKETIFTNSNTNPFLQNGESDSSSRDVNGGGGVINGNNPFTATNGLTETTTTGGKYATIGRSNPFTKSVNPFLDNALSKADSAKDGGDVESSHGNGNTSSSSSNDASMEPIATISPAAEAEKTLNKIVSKFSWTSRTLSKIVNHHPEHGESSPKGVSILSFLSLRAAENYKFHPSHNVTSFFMCNLNSRRRPSPRASQSPGRSRPSAAR